ncbi:hypothetical protein KR222_008003 [Zaprionus bogoriensis]|nr:hypothetical protein KR222_008003 [Zaprionus bogoriensis]
MSSVQRPAQKQSAPQLYNDKMVIYGDGIIFGGKPQPLIVDGMPFQPMGLPQQMPPHQAQPLMQGHNPLPAMAPNPYVTGGPMQPLPMGAEPQPQTILQQPQTILQQPQQQQPQRQQGSFPAIQQSRQAQPTAMSTQAMQRQQSPALQPALQQQPQQFQQQPMFGGGGGGGGGNMSPATMSPALYNGHSRMPATNYEHYFYGYMPAPHPPTWSGGY